MYLYFFLPQQICCPMRRKEKTNDIMILKTLFVIFLLLNSMIHLVVFRCIAIDCR